MIEICAGREGDDEHVRIVAGATVDTALVEQIENVLRGNAWATEVSDDLYDLDETDYHVGPFGMRDQNRALDSHGMVRKNHANMIAGRPWGCSEAELWEF